MQIRKREQMDPQYLWRLEDIVPSDAAWQETYEALCAHKSDIAAFDGKLTQADAVLECLRLESAQSASMERLYVYARMRSDQDVSNAVYQTMCDKIETLSVEMGTIASFVRPQLTANPTEFLQSLAEDPRFAEYDYGLRELIRNQAHTLSQPEEKLLAQAGSFAGLFHDAFNVFDNAEVRFRTFRDSEGKTVRLSHGLYSVYMQSECRDDRRKADRSMMGAYRDMIQTVGTLYAGNVKKDVFYAKARNYDSCLAKALNTTNVPVAVYDRLIECVNGALDGLHAYLAYRKRKLGVDRLRMYDLHVPLVPNSELRVEYKQAQQIVLRALAPLGEEYRGLLEQAFADGWIDVYENKGKRSGAYSWGCYGTHPYVLLNYQPVTHDVFTLAHELGHAMHSYYSNAAQPYDKAGYEIFVAEVASTVNETLLLRHLLAQASPEQEAYLLTYMLDMFRTTVFRQTQFAEFEERAHAMAERGESLTAQALCDAYAELNRRYYTDETGSDEYIRYEWARIPHFYRSFYVYQYATGLISAVCIADKILTEGEPAVKAYKKFLSAGGSMPPCEILKLAGVDLTTEQPYRTAMNFFRDTLARLEALEKQETRSDRK